MELRESGVRIAITGESALRILLNRTVDIPEVALVWPLHVADGWQIADDVMSIVKAGLENGLCRADAELEASFASGTAHTVKEFEKELPLRMFNATALAFFYDRDMELTLLDPLDHVAGILQKTLKLTTAGKKSEMNLDWHRTAVLLASRYGFEADGDLRHHMNKGASVWNLTPPLDRGTLLLDIMGGDSPSSGLILMLESGVMSRVYPFLHDLAGTEEKVIENEQGRRKYHHKDVFYHTMQVLDNICELTDDVWLRFAALLHDVAKPRTKAFSEETGWTFHGHAEIGARMVKRMFKEYEYPEDRMRYVRKLVALHLRPMALVSEGVTDSAVRRLITDAGGEMEDLLTLCRCDITSKNPGKVTRYLDNYDRLVDTVHDVLDRDRLREWQPPITGQEIMEACNILPGIMVGVLKTRIENAVLSGEIENTNEAARRYLESIKDEALGADEKTKPVSKKQSMKTLPGNLAK